MKVILLEDVKALGKKGEIVTTSDAYARNVLFSKKLALEANNKNLNDLKLKQKQEIIENIRSNNYGKNLLKEKSRSRKTKRLNSLKFGNYI